MTSVAHGAELNVAQPTGASRPRSGVTFGPQTSTGSSGGSSSGSDVVLQRDLTEYPTSYQRVKELGKGRFGVVYEVKDPQSGTTFAAKHIK